MTTKDSAGGGKCWVVGTILSAALSHELTATIEVANAALEAAYPPCPGATAPATPEPPTPAQLAEAFWDTIPLPTPRPASPPGTAITGQPAYLLTGDTATPAPWTRTTPFGPLTITATGSYTVDWGDHSPVTGPYATTGGPYPTGTITHTYEIAGTDTITVTETWTATWHIGAAHGTLRQLRTTGTIPDFTVGQVQAVITG